MPRIFTSRLIERGRCSSAPPQAISMLEAEAIIRGIRALAGVGFV